ncbi:MAG: DUF3703 domain-containing protein [Woeseiaceae bacterium]
MKIHRALAEAIEAEFDEARCKLTAGNTLHSFAHLERAHVLGQKHTRTHIRAHWMMLRYSRQYGGVRDFLGQVGRLLGAALFTWAWVPEGNTGGTNIGALEKRPIPPELRRLISPTSPQE